MKPQVFLTMLALYALPSALDAAGMPRPNLLFILADDLGWNDLSFAGSEFYETPHIDSLARSGMVFHQAYASSPLCSPSRAAILTGLNPARIGITWPFCHLPEVVLEKGLEASSPPSHKALQARIVTRLDTRYHTLAESFKTAGYLNGHFGKWHLGREPYSPLQHGFDIDIPHTDAPGPLPEGFFHPFPVWPGHGNPGDNLEDLLVEEAVKFIRHHKDRPFFLNYWAFQVHSPWQAKEAQIEKYRKKADPHALQRNPVYAGMVETLDDAVGRIVSALEETGVLERTIIVLTSDNGPFFTASKAHMPGEFSQVPVTSAQPLRAGKGTIYEGGLRVPLIVVWPGVTRPGSETEALVTHADFFPTLADMLDLEVPAGVAFDGVSQRRVFEGGPPPRDEFFCHFPHRQAVGRYPHQPAPTPHAPASILRKGDWKLIRYYLEGPDFTNHHELYYLEHDPGERTNLAPERPGKVRELSIILDRHLVDTGAVIPAQNPAYQAPNPVGH